MLIGASMVRCTRTSRDAAEEERSSLPTLVFVRRGAFRYEGTSGRALADPNSVLLFHPDEPYAISHPCDDGDECVAVHAGSDLLSDAVGSAGDRPNAWVPSATAARAMHRELDALLASGERLEREERGVAVLTLLAGALPPLDRRSRDTRAIDAVREAIAAAPGDRVALAGLARIAGMSPFHLARRFRARTGTSIHQYRTTLRLATARARLHGGDGNVTRIATDLGFVSASHFGAAYLRAYGVAPSSDFGRLRTI